MTVASHGWQAKVAGTHPKKSQCRLVQPPHQHKLDKFGKATPTYPQWSGESISTHLSSQRIWVSGHLTPLSGHVSLLPGSVTTVMLQLQVQPPGWMTGGG